MQILDKLLFQDPLTQQCINTHSSLVVQYACKLLQLLYCSNLPNFLKQSMVSIIKKIRYCKFIVAPYLQVPLQVVWIYFAFLLKVLA